VTNHIGDFEKAGAATEKAFDELDKVLDELAEGIKNMKLFLKKRREQCQKSGKKKLSS
jgi:hypothetical protein